jgi:hypothetical protein
MSEGKTDKSVIVKKVTQMSEVSKVCIPRFIIRKTEEYLKNYGSEDKEGLLFWAGIANGEQGVVTTCVFPKFSSSQLQFHPYPSTYPSPLSSKIETYSIPIAQISAEDGSKIVSEIRKRGLYVLAQVHSHPSGAFHSSVDDANAFALYTGYLSVVVPDFCREGMEPITRCAFFVCQQNKTFRKLSETEITNRILIVDDELDLDVGIE